jgi:hypothetical protein
MEVIISSFPTTEVFMHLVIEATSLTLTVPECMVPPQVGAAAIGRIRFCSSLLMLRLLQIGRVIGCQRLRVVET